MELHLADLMNPTPLTVAPTDSLAAAAHVRAGEVMRSRTMVSIGPLCLATWAL